MDFIFKDDTISGDMCDILILISHPAKIEHMTKNIVEERVDPFSFMNYYYCNMVHVFVCNDENFRECICGRRLYNIIFIGENFKGEDIGFCMSRFS